MNFELDDDPRLFQQETHSCVERDGVTRPTWWRDTRPGCRTTARLFKIGPITNEMGRNAIAENLGLPRSF
jgi:hypothetical protein